jgi:hypothetical protein
LAGRVAGDETERGLIIMTDLFGYERPAAARLIRAMGRLSHRQREQVIRLGARKAKAARMAIIRRLAREAAAEARQLAQQLADGEAAS